MRNYHITVLILAILLPIPTTRELTLHHCPFPTLLPNRNFKIGKNWLFLLKIKKKNYIVRWGAKIIIQSSRKFRVIWLFKLPPQNGILRKKLESNFPNYLGTYSNIGSDFYPLFFFASSLFKIFTCLFNVMFFSGQFYILYKHRIFVNEFKIYCANLFLADLCFS